MATNDNVFELNAWRQHLQNGERGPKRNLTNTIWHLRGIRDLGRNLRFNEMAQQCEWRGRALEEPDIVDIRMIIEAENYQPQDRDIRPAIDRVCRDNPYNPVTDYLKSLKWDGVKRLEWWLQKLLGAPDTPFVRIVGPKVLISAVARAIDPGCKVDTVLVIEGPQGLKKSSAIAALFGDEHTAESVSIFGQHNKMVMQMMGAWCVELAEFVAILRKDQNEVKGLLSMRSDKVVLPYAKIASTHPRRCIFFGTINPDEIGYLTDNTGNRRYWPIAATQIDIEGIRSRRDQLWAEAYDIYINGARWWLEGDENIIAEEQAAERMEEDAWTEPLRIAIDKEEFRLGTPISELTVNIALDLIGVPSERKDKRAQMRAASALKALGYERKTIRPVGRKPQKLWLKGGE